MRYIIVLSYDGFKFCGWQVQNNAKSIQGELQQALGTLLGEMTPVTGAGRTDSLVNAIGYTAHFDTNRPIPDTEQFRYKLNAILPYGITVHRICPADEGFHARFDALSREYHYFIHRRKDPFVERFSWQCHHDLDMDRMNAAASFLLGKHDFSCFEKTGGNNATSICTVFSAAWESYTPTHVGMMGYPAEKDDYIVFTIKADRFLRNMVRAVVGSLVEVGRGKKEPEWILTLLKEGSRSDAGESVPGHALFFSGAEYPENM